MNYRYYNDAMKNYLVVDCGEAPDDPGQKTEDRGGSRQQGYQYQMISVNRIPGLLPCSLRLIDQRQCLYYDITSLRNLKSLYQDRGQAGGTQKKLLYSLADAGESIARYLLDSRRILLDPEFIYYDYQLDEYLFIYYPEEENSYEKLLDFLVGGILPEDKQNAGAVYQLQEMAQNPNFILTGAVLDGVYGRTGQYQDRRESQAGRQSTMLNSGWQSTQPGGMEDDLWTRCGRAAAAAPGEADLSWNRTWEVQGNGTAANPGRERWDERTTQKQDPADTADGSENRAGRTLLWALLFLGIACGAEFLHVRLSLTQPYDLICRAVVAAGICVSVLLAFYGIFLSLRTGGRHTVKKADPGSRPVMEPTLDFRKRELEAGIRRGSASSEGVYGGGMAAAGPGPLEGESSWRQNPVSGIHQNPQETSVTQHKLYGEDECRSCRIDLRHLPCTVGSQGGTCSVQLEDPSISAMHVRFGQGENGQVVMTDLGSTQGTYLNGCRLRAEESREIMPGDEVRIGRYVFCYR